MLQVSQLHNRANERLTQVENPKKIALIHTAIALGASFLLTLVGYLLSLEIADNGGLSGLGTRTVLSTIQAMLELVVMVGLPFWQMGIFYAALRWCKKESATISDLLQGFRRLGATLGLLLLKCALYVALGVIAVYISTFIFMMTPFAEPLMEILEPIMGQSLTAEQLTELLTPELMAEATQAAMPMLILYGVLYIAVALPAFYRTRFADFAVMDGMAAGKAMVNSFTSTKGYSWKVVRVDLSFWWFYLLQMLSVALCNGDLILTYLGVSLPFAGVGLSLALYALGSICQILLLWQYEAKRLTVYGLVYRTLEGEEAEPAVVAEG